MKNCVNCGHYVYAHDHGTEKCRWEDPEMCGCAHKRSDHDVLPVGTRRCLIGGCWCQGFHGEKCDCKEVVMPLNPPPECPPRPYRPGDPHPPPIFDPDDVGKPEEDVLRKPPSDEEICRFESGAVRSKDADDTRYDLISPIGLRRLAETCAEGAVKYSDYNWEKGIDVGNILNHAIRHIYLFLEGDRSEDHLGHAMWGCMAACHFEELRPELCKNLRGEGCTPPEECK